MNSKTIIGIAITILILIALGLLASIKFIPETTIDEIRCELKAEGIYPINEANLEFNCPKGFLCRATPILECNTQGIEEIVISRFDNFDTSSGWLAYNKFKIERGLQSYEKTNTLSSSCETADNLCEKHGEITEEVIDLPLDLKGALCKNGWIITANTNKDYECTENSVVGYKQTVRYRLGGSANIDSDTSDCDSPLTECIGDSKFKCEENVLLNGKIITTLEYGSDYSSPPGEPKKGVTYSTSTIPAFKTGDTLSFSKIEFQKWYCPEQVTKCYTTTGHEIEIGEEECVSSTKLEKCTFNTDTGNANREELVVVECCILDKDCDDNLDNTQDVCIENECNHNSLENFCYNKNDCLPSNDEWICEANECIYPTTGIYCPSAQQGETRCNENILEVCRPNSDFEGTFTWQFSQDCSSSEEVCSE